MRVTRPFSLPVAAAALALFASAGPALGWSWVTKPYISFNPNQVSGVNVKLQFVVGIKTVCVDGPCGTLTRSSGPCPANNYAAYLDAFEWNASTKTYYGTSAVSFDSTGNSGAVFCVPNDTSPVISTLTAREVTAATTIVFGFTQAVVSAGRFLQPSLSVIPVQVGSVSCPATVMSGDGATARVLLTGVSSYVHKLKVASSNPTVLSVPDVEPPTIPAGGTFIDVRMASTRVKVDTPVTITASDQYVSKSCVVTVKPQPLL